MATSTAGTCAAGAGAMSETLCYLSIGLSLLAIAISARALLEHHRFAKKAREDEARFLQETAQMFGDSGD